MAYLINWEPALCDLESFDSEIRKRIIKKIGSITDNPFQFVGRLTGYPLFKLRIGDYRAILDIKTIEKLIVVVLVDHRSKVYKELSRRI